MRVFRNIMKVNTLLRDSHRQVVDPLGLSLSEFDLLATLGNTEGSRMKDIAERMITSPSNVTRVCVALEKKNLLERRRSEHSDREVVARLTPKGQALFERIFLHVADFTSDLIDSALSEREQETVAKLLDQLAENLAVPAPDPIEVG